MQKFKEFTPKKPVIQHPLNTMVAKHPGIHGLQGDPAVKHAATNIYLDVDSDVDKYDKPGANIPDEIPVGTDKLTKKMFAKYKGEAQHTRKGIAYEQKKVRGFKDWKKDSSC